jgi:hypothetical protein
VTATPPLAAFHNVHPKPAAEIEEVKKEPANVMKRKREKDKYEQWQRVIRQCGSIGN